MKKIFIVLFVILTGLTCFGQESSRDLPQYYILEGDTIGIVLSIEQAQKLDNDIEILGLLETLSLECDSLDIYYVKIINGLDEVIALYELKVKNLTDQGNIKDEEIKKLKYLIQLREDQLKLSENQKTNDSIIIKTLKKDINRIKTKNVVTLTSGIIITVVLVLLNLFN